MCSFHSALCGNNVLNLFHHNFPLQEELLSTLLLHRNNTNEAYEPECGNFRTENRVGIYVHCCFCACLKNKVSIVVRQSSLQRSRSCSLMKVGSLHTGAFCLCLTSVSPSIFCFHCAPVQLSRTVSLLPGDGV